MSKKSNRRRHFLSRLMDRFGISISASELDFITQEIIDFNNKPIIINSDTGNSFHKTNIQGIEIAVLFDWECETPLTAYYMSWLKLDESGNYTFKHRAKRKDARIFHKSVTFEHKTGLKNYNLI